MNSQKWVSTWGNSPSFTERRVENYTADVTLRYVVRSAFDASAVSLRFSNVCNRGKATVNKVTVAKTGDDPCSILTQTLKTVTFDGNEAFTMEIDGDCVSDAIDFPIKKGEDMSISFYIKDVTPIDCGTNTSGPLSLRFFTDGDRCCEENFPLLSKQTDGYCRFLNTVDLLTDEKCRSVIAFGDSITNGSQSEYPSMTYVNQVARMLDAEVYNFGIGGEYFMEEKIIPGTYPSCDFVTVAYGTNDYRIKNEEYFSHNMPAFFRKVAAEFPEKPIFVILPIWREREEANEVFELGTLQSVRDRVTAEAAKYPNMTVIDAKDFVPHYEDFFGDKALHPNAMGMSQYAMHLYAAMKDLV